MYAIIEAIRNDPDYFHNHAENPRDEAHGFFTSLEDLKIHFAEKDEILWDDFSFTRYYEGEKKILGPQLYKLGFTNVTWRTGERDDFGPLSRIADLEHDEFPGQQIVWVYG